MRIEYVAHACFVIESPGGVRALVDPYNGTRWLGYWFPEGIRADVVLVSHPHYDHDASYYAPASAPVLRTPGVRAVGDVRVTGIEGRHAEPWGEEFGRTNTLWLIETGGLRIAHLGDTGRRSSEASRKALGRIDVLMLPVDDQDHILKRSEIAAIRSGSVQAAISVPMHYRLAPLTRLPDSLGTIDAWLSEQRNVVRLGSHTTVVRDRPREPQGPGVPALSRREAVAGFALRSLRAPQPGPRPGAEARGPRGRDRRVERAWRSRGLGCSSLTSWRGAQRGGTQAQAVSGLESALAAAGRDDWEYTARARHLLARLYAERGDHARAAQQYRLVLRDGRATSCARAPRRSWRGRDQYSRNSRRSVSNAARPPPRALQVRPRPALAPLPHPGPARDHVDGQAVVFVFVGRLLPGEVAGVPLHDPAQQAQAGAHRVERRAVHRDARRRRSRRAPRASGTSGWKAVGRTTAPARQAGYSRSRCASRGSGFTKGAAHCSSGRVVPRPSERFVPSKYTKPGNVRQLSAVGMFGEGDTNSEAGRVPVVAALPARHRDHVQRHAAPDVQLVALVHQSGQLGHREAVPGGHRVEADERAIGGVELGALDRGAPDRVGPVQHHDLLAQLRRRLHHVAHRVGERVDARADVLQVHHQRVDVGEHGGRRLARLAVEAVERKALPLGVPGLDHVVLVLAPEPVLRREERGHAEAERSAAAPSRRSIACRPRSSTDAS